MIRQGGSIGTKLRRGREQKAKMSDSFRKRTKFTFSRLVMRGYLRAASTVSDPRRAVCRSAARHLSEEKKRNAFTIQVVWIQFWSPAPGKVVWRRLGDRREAADKDRIHPHKWITLFLYLKPRPGNWNKRHYHSASQQSLSKHSVC